MLSPMTGYAATALAWLAAHDGEPAPVESIASSAGIPGAYLGKIMHQLSRRNIVTARRGVGGGMVLNADPRALTLHDLCEALDDPMLVGKCMLGVAECSDERACPAHAFWKADREGQIAFLKRTTIADIQEFERKRNPRWGLLDEEERP